MNYKQLYKKYSIDKTNIFPRLKIITNILDNTSGRVRVETSIIDTMILISHPHPRQIYVVSVYNDTKVFRQRS